MPSMHKLRTLHYLKRAGVLVLLLLVGAGLYFGVQTNAWKNTLETLTHMGTSPESKPEEIIDNDNFEMKLESSSIQQLILQATQLIDEPNTGTIERLEQQQKKIRIAEELVARDGSTRAVNFGIATKISALRTRELINFDNGLSNPASLEELDKFARKYLTSFDEDTLRQANLGQLTVQVLQDLLKSGTDEFVINPSVLRLFEATAKKYTDDIIVAEELFSLLMRIHIHLSESDRDQFLNLYSQLFEVSRVEKIRLIATNASKELIDSEFQLTQIFDVIESQRATAILQLREQVNNAFAQGYISQLGYYRIFEAVEDVAKAGNYSVALELAELLEDHIRGKAILSRLSAKCLRFKTRLRLVGQTFNYDAIKNLRGTLVSLRFPDAPLKALLFVDGNQFDEVEEFLFTITRIAGRDIPSQRFCLAVVFTKNDPQVSIQRVIEKISRLLPIIEVTRLDTQIESGKRLADSLAISDSSLLVLLNEKDKVVAIGIEQRDFEKRYVDLQKD